MRNGRLVVSEWLEALCSCSGATTQTSAERSRAISSNSLIPGDATPSSLVTRMRALASSMRPSAKGFAMGYDDLLASHIGLQYWRQRHGAVVPLEVLEDRDERAPNRQTRAIEGVNRRSSSSLGRTVARLHAQGLERPAIRAAGNLAVGALPRQPYFDIVGLLRGKSHVAGRQQHHPVGEAEAL